MDPSGSLGDLLRLVDDLRAVDEGEGGSFLETVRTVSAGIRTDEATAALGLTGEELQDLCSQLERSLSDGAPGPDVLEILDRIHAVASSVIPECESEPEPDPVDEFFEEGLGIFLSSAVGLIADIEEEILNIESGGGADELAGNFRRLVHTLKAEFSVLGMSGGSELCHTAEDLVDVCAAAQSAFPVDAMLLVVDWLKAFIEKLSADSRATPPDHGPTLARLHALRDSLDGNGGQNPDSARSGPIEFDIDPLFADSVAEFAPEAVGHLSDAEAALLELEHAESSDAMDRAFRAVHTIKGVASFLNLAEMVAVTHEAESILDGWRNGSFDASQVSLLLEAIDLIGRMNQGLEDPSAMPTYGEAIDLRQRMLEAVGGSAPDTTDTPESAVAVPVPIPSAGSTPTSTGGGSGVKSTVATTVKVNTMRLDALVDMVGELVIAQSMVLQDPTVRRLQSHALSRNIAQVSKITRDLQESAMSLRMVTVRATLQKMSRLVRDVATKSGKKVRLNVHGEDTELDRTVVERIADPLVHLVRNAVDHGLESPAERRDAAKDETGNLWLSAYHQGGAIVIEIRDDGRGMDRQKILEKGIERGLVTPEQAADMSDTEAFQLIFSAGFSTAEKVTDISGRGVGMDVVRRNIEDLRGKVEIDSRLGEGTVFRLRLPLTLAIIDGMIVRVGSERFVLPTLAIEQSFRPDSDDVHYVADSGECVRVRGTVLPIYRLKRLFLLEDGQEDLMEGILIIVEADAKRVCLFVDEILGQQQVVIKSLGMDVVRDRMKGVSGGAIMSDGRIALILDAGSMAAHHNENAPVAASQV